VNHVNCSSYEHDRHFDRATPIYQHITCFRCKNETPNFIIRHIPIIEQHICYRCCAALTIAEVYGISDEYDVEPNELFKQL
jgi:hypothetical protein